VYAFLTYPGTGVHAYHCYCGGWHVGNRYPGDKKPTPLTQRIEVPNV
jgi:hypothetical protein